MGAFSIPTFSGGDFGSGDIFVPGALQNPTANPYNINFATLPGGIFGPGVTPAGVPTNTQSSGLDDSNPLNWLQTLLPFAQLGTNAFLSNQALTSSRPSTVQVLPNGQTIVTGGGAALPSSLSSIPSIVWIGLVLLIVIMVIHK